MTGSGPVLIAGGYGLVGAQVAELLRARHPDLPIVLGGRRPETAAGIAERLGADVTRLDVMADDPLGELAPSAVIAAVNDPDDRLLMAAVHAGVPYVDITRWTSLVRRAALRLVTADVRAPVMLSSGWMGGVASLAAGRLAETVGPAASIEVSILYALADRAGADSFDFVDRMAEPFEVTVGGVARTVHAVTDGRRVAFDGAGQARVYRIDTPEQATLPLTTGARTVETRIGYDSALATWSLRAMRTTGVLRALSSPRLAGLRRSLLHSSGDGGVARLSIDVDGAGGRASAQISDPEGQSHLTAVGATIAFERATGLDALGPEPAGARFPEQHPDLAAALDVLRAHGVTVSLGGVA